MIRERQVQTAAYSSGTTQTVDLPRDAVYHMIQLSVRQGTFTQAVADSGVGDILSDCFPFNIIKNLRLIRNGSDVVWQGSGVQLSKEHLFLNKSHPFARLYTTASNADTLRTATYQGVTIPANSQGIGEAAVQFPTTPTAATTAPVTSVTYFDFLMELWLQIGVDDVYYGTLVDARKLASYQLELQYESIANLYAAGTGTSAQAIVASIQVSSYDQDNLDVKEQFGTFKRSSLSLNNIPYGSSNQQILLPRGNYFHGIIIETMSAKSSGGAFSTNMRHESGNIGQINNRINSNYTLRAVTFKDLASKHLADGGIDSPWNTTSTSPNGFAYLSYPMVGKRGAELIPTYVMDQFDLQIATNASTAQENTAASASTNPTITLLLQEVIPGVSIGDMAPKGAFAGSSRATSAKPYAS